jgi:nucleotide-binding universal stress UspA family protein
MFKTIAWATDCSPSALNALRVAKRLARESGAKLVIITVQELGVGRAGILVDSNEAANNALHRTADRLRDEGIDTAVLVSRAPGSGAAREIADLATRAGADVIVIGNRQHGPLASLALGSVAPRLLQTAPCPVLMVASRQTPDTPETNVQRAELAATTHGFSPSLARQLYEQRL